MIKNKGSIKGIKSIRAKIIHPLNTHGTRDTLTRGFTLVEILIVLAVIAGLSTLFLTSFPAAQRRGRDTQRRNDMKQYQTALETYANRTSNYPTASGNLANQCSALGLTGCPDDPAGGSNRYRIASNSTSYVIWTRLEAPVDTTRPYFVICSNGKAAEYTQPSGTNCPLP